MATQSTFNGSATSQSYSLLTRVNDESTFNSTEGQGRIVVLSELETDHSRDGVAADTPAASVRSDSHTGCVAGVSALSQVELYRLQAWDAPNLPKAVADKTPSANAPAPSAAQQDTQYNAFVTSSYLPTSEVPGKDEFVELNNPEKRVGKITQSWGDIGLHRYAAAPVSPFVAPGQEVVELLPTNLPYTASLQRYCSDRLFGSTLVV